MFFRHVFCGDYIFSGHTMTLVKSALHHVVINAFIVIHLKGNFCPPKKYSIELGHNVFCTLYSEKGLKQN